MIDWILIQMGILLRWRLKRDLSFATICCSKNATDWAESKVASLIHEGWMVVKAPKYWKNKVDRFA